MTRSDQNKYAMYDAMRRYLAESNEIWKETPGFSANAEKFIELFNQCGDIQLLLRATTKPTTAKKHADLDELSKKAVYLQGVFRSWALAEEVKEFDALLKMNLTDLKYGGSRQRSINVRHLVDMASKNAEKLNNFGWSNERQKEIASLLEMVINDLIAPTSMRQELKNQRLKLKKIFNDMDKILKAMDMLIVDFETENAEFASGWKFSRQIIDYKPKTKDSNEELLVDLTEEEDITSENEDPPTDLPENDQE